MLVPHAPAGILQVLHEPGDIRQRMAVAAFGQLLKGGEYIGDFGYADVAELAAGARGADPFGYRGEFLGLVRLADSLAPQIPLVSEMRR